jgi:HSP20 family protein
MSEEMDHTFGQFFGRSSSGGSRNWNAEMELTDRDGQLHIHADLPDLKPEDVKVEINEGTLVISGERKSEHEHQIGQAHHSERRYGRLYREIALPQGTNAEQAKAQFRDGALEITVPVPQRASNRRGIPVQTGESASSPSKGPGSAESTRINPAAPASCCANIDYSTNARPTPDRRHGAFRRYVFVSRVHVGGTGR